MNCSDRDAGTIHVPVMFSEVLNWIGVRSNGVYIDATLGAGGHAKALLEGSAPYGLLIGIDRDEKIIEKARERLSRFGERVRFAHSAFDRVEEIARGYGVGNVDGILADLGVSSMQLDVGERGFSFMNDGPLDMRMDTSRGESAADFIARAEENELADVIFKYGEERFSRRIAKRICEERKRRPILTTLELARIVEAAVPGKRGRIHPATRTFQGFRIFVNDELGMLKRFLESAPDILKPGGRLVVISYHSLEDRIVKNMFKELAKKSVGKVLTKKVIIPTCDEIEKNPRSRSAKMRVFEKI